MIRTSLLKRQLRRLFNVDSPEALSDLMTGLSQSSSPAAANVLGHFPAFIRQIDDAYWQAERDLDLRSRSLELSSQELTSVNIQLASQLENQQMAMHSLKSIAARLSSQIGVIYDDTDTTLESATQLLTQLVESHEQMSKSLRISEERFKLAIAATGIGLWDWSLALGTVYYSDQWCALLGYASVDISPNLNAWNKLIHAEDLQQFKQNFTMMLNGLCSVFDIRLRMRHKEGHYLWIQVHGRIVSALAEGQAERALGTMINISERMAVEEAIIKAKEAAEANSRAKSDFLANVSHEIRTPMNGIIGMTKLCLDTQLSDEQQEYLDMVSTSASSLLTLINNLLDFSKIEAGKMSLDPTNFNLYKLVHDIIGPLSLRSQDKGLKLICSIKPDVPRNLFADAGRLRQILINLLGNAIKFTDNGSVSLNISTKPLDDQNYLLTISVKDTGIGIAPQMQKMIFESFSQGDSSITRRFGGTGLGLTISANLVDLMQGKLEVDSSGDGSDFYFTIPVLSGSEDDSIPVAPEALRQLPVLVVDDDATDRRLMHEILHGFGMKPIVVQDARNAMIKLLDQALDNQPFKLVLLDAKMPDHDGFDLAKDIKKNKQLGDPCIIMFSSITDSPNSATLQQLGISGFLSKPIDPSELFNYILAVLGKTLHLPTPIKPLALANPKASHIMITPTLPPLQILLAEDNTINQRLAMRILDKMGHSVTLARDGIEAFNAAISHDYDLILMDVQMPNMGGVDSTKKIREWDLQHQKPHQRIIAMTAHAMQGDKERFLDQGMDGYVSKPIDQAHLVTEISRVLTLYPKIDIESKACATPSAPPQVFDYEKTLEFMGNDSSLVVELAEIFILESPERMQSLRQAVAARDAEQIYLVTHKLKGESANFGHPRVEEYAEMLSMKGRTHDLSDVDQLFSQLELEVKYFIDDIKYRLLR